MKPVVVLDTNIFISAVFWEGKSYSIIQKAINQDILVFISDDIIKEIKLVLARDFGLVIQEIDDVIDAIALFTHLIEPKEKVGIVKEHPNDNRIVECALECEAGFILTYDKHLLKIKEYRNINIRRPEEFD